MVVSILSMVRDLKARSPPVLKVSALKGDGLDSLVGAIDKVRARFESGDEQLRLRSLKGMMMEMAKGDVLERFTSKAGVKADRLAKEVLAGRLTLGQAAEKLEK
jgi:putative protein kinase ArgK-like GTPase of G3E family